MALCSATSTATVVQGGTYLVAACGSPWARIVFQQLLSTGSRPHRCVADSVLVTSSSLNSSHLDSIRVTVLSCRCRDAVWEGP